MQIKTFSDPGDFLRDAMPMLALREAENNLIIGRAMNVAKPWPADALLAAVKDAGGQTVAAAMMTPPNHFVLTDGPANAIELLADHLKQSGSKFPGVCGPVAAVETFVQRWASRVGSNMPRLHRSLRIFQLDKVDPPARLASGGLIEATQADAELLEKWWDAFGHEIGEELSRQNAREGIATRLTDRQIFVWRDPGVVSMAAWAGPTPRGVRINLVYTPPDLRARGYASACVAALSQRLLDSRKKFCFLFTDLANPTSNSIYRKIGYRAVCDWMVYNL